VAHIGLRPERIRIHRRVRGGIFKTSGRGKFVFIAQHKKKQNHCHQTRFWAQNVFKMLLRPLGSSQRPPNPLAGFRGQPRGKEGRGTGTGREKGRGREQEKGKVEGRRGVRGRNGKGNWGRGWRSGPWRDAPDLPVVFSVHSSKIRRRVIWAQYLRRRWQCTVQQWIN